jgi:Flp pilus assembly protein TadD
MRADVELREVFPKHATKRHACCRKGDSEAKAVAVNQSPVAVLAAASEITGLLRDNFEQSLAALEKAATVDPRNPNVLEDLGDTYLGLQRYQDAERTVNRLSELSTN